MLANSADSVVRGLLLSGERVFWSAQPRQGVFLRREDRVAIPFGIIWFGFACFWVHGVLATEEAPIMAVMGIPAVFIGIYLVVGRLFADSWKRARTYFALTNRAVLRAYGTGTRMTVERVPLKDLADPALTEKPGGYADLFFTGPAGMLNFEDVADGRRVLAALSNAKREIELFGEGVE